MKKLYTTLSLLLISIYHFAQTPNWIWAKSATGNNYSSSQSIVTDVDGNIYAAGTFLTSVTLGTTTLTSSGFQDIFLAKYNPSGNVIWAKKWGGNSDELVGSITTDSFGNIFLAGYFGSTSITFGQTVLVNSSSTHSDFYLVKCDSSGTVLWAKSGKGIDDERVTSTTVDSYGNAYIAGFFYSQTFIVESDTLVRDTIGTIGSINTSSDAFLLKYSANGALIWSRRIGAQGYDFAAAVTIDPANNIYISGMFDYSITIGSTILTALNAQDIFLAKYDINGNPIWAKSGNGNTGSNVSSLSIDHFGNLFVTGYSSANTLTFDTHTITSSGVNDIFLVKYNSNGTVAWGDFYGGSSFDFVSSSTTDSSGNIYVTGFIMSPSIAFGSYFLNNPTGADTYITKINSSGIVLWAKALGGINNFRSYITLTNDAIYFSGGYGSTISLGSTTLVNTSGKVQMLIAKLDTTISVNTTEINRNKNGIEVIPNPFSSETSLCFSREQENTAIRIVNFLGKEVKTFKFSGKCMVINKEELAMGIYFLQTIDEKNNILTKKLIIQ